MVSPYHNGSEIQEAGLQSKPYAYGIFDDVSNLKLNLLDGYKYRVACTMIENAKDSLQHKDNKFARPFSLDRNGEVFGEIKNQFFLADQPDGSQLFLFDADNSKIGTKYQMVSHALISSDITGSSIHWKQKPQAMNSNCTVAILPLNS